MTSSRDQIRDEIRQQIQAETRARNAEYQRHWRQRQREKAHQREKASTLNSLAWDEGTDFDRLSSDHQELKMKRLQLQFNIEQAKQKTAEEERKKAELEYKTMQLKQAHRFDSERLSQRDTEVKTGSHDSSRVLLGE